MEKLGLIDRIYHAYTVFRDSRSGYHAPAGQTSYWGGRPDRVRLNVGNERSIITSVYNRIAIDVADHVIKHVRLDEDGKYLDDIDSGLNNCLTTEANIDQSGRSLIQDAVLTMFDQGAVALVPVETNINPELTAGFDVKSLRAGKVIEWFPRHVSVDLYNDNTGSHQDVFLPKKIVAIAYNPLYAVMNEPNSTLKRLVSKLNILDTIDTQSGSGKLDLIVQLPYGIKTAAKRQQAETRRADIEAQLVDSKYGIAYTDGTERVIQLNRPAENNLMGQIEYLTAMLYSQLGITEEVFLGVADEATMLNYYARTVRPVLMALIDAMKRRFLSKTARAQGQSIAYFRDPFDLVTASDFAEISDKFTRNEIVSSNEVRARLGLKPSEDPGADELRNKNLNAPDENTEELVEEPPEEE
jgi:hypothetical protein